MSIWLPIVIVLGIILGILMWATIAGWREWSREDIDQSEYLPAKEEEVDGA